MNYSETDWKKNNILFAQGVDEKEVKSLSKTHHSFIFGFSESTKDVIINQVDDERHLFN